MLSRETIIEQAKLIRVITLNSVDSKFRVLCVYVFACMLFYIIPKYLPVYLLEEYILNRVDLSYLSKVKDSVGFTDKKALI